jgi:hypothetical protein
VSTTRAFSDAGLPPFPVISGGDSLIETNAASFPPRPRYARWSMAATPSSLDS